MFTTSTYNSCTFGMQSILRTELEGNFQLHSIIHMHIYVIINKKVTLVVYVFEYFEFSYFFIISLANNMRFKMFFSSQGDTLTSFIGSPSDLSTSTRSNHKALRKSGLKRCSKGSSTK